MSVDLSCLDRDGVVAIQNIIRRHGVDSTQIESLQRLAYLQVKLARAEAKPLSSDRADAIHYCKSSIRLWQTLIES